MIACSFWITEGWKKIPIVITGPKDAGNKQWTKLREAAHVKQ